MRRRHLVIPLVCIPSAPQGREPYPEMHSYGESSEVMTADGGDKDTEKYSAEDEHGDEGVLVVKTNAHISKTTCVDFLVGKKKDFHGITLHSKGKKFRNFSNYASRINLLGLL